MREKKGILVKQAESHLSVVPQCVSQMQDLEIGVKEVTA